MYVKGRNELLCAEIIAISEQCAGETREGGTSHPPAAEGNFWYESWNALKPQVV
jgi:hypothetical protein